jgi:hypothetical protein
MRILTNFSKDPKGGEGNTESEGYTERLELISSFLGNGKTLIQYH